MRLVRSPEAPKITSAQGVDASSSGAGASFGIVLVDACTLIAFCPRRVADLLSQHRLDEMAAKLVPKRRDQLGSKGLLLARAEAREEGVGENGGRDVPVDRFLDRPAPFAGVLDITANSGQVRVLGQRPFG